MGDCSRTHSRRRSGISWATCWRSAWTSPGSKNAWPGGTYAAKVQQSVADGLKAGVRGTPTFFVGSTEPGDAPVKAQRAITGAQPYQAFKEVIESLLAGSR